MINNKDENYKKVFRTVDNYENELAVCCKTVVNKDSITNYLINIQDYAGGVTILLDKDGNTILSQVSLMNF